MTRIDIENLLRSNPLEWVFIEYPENKNNRCICYENTKKPNCVFLVIDKIYYIDKTLYSLRLVDKIDRDCRNYSETIGKAASIEELISIANNYIINLVCSSLGIKE